jgi:branched-chain amino acid transport system substrate-binding protein
MRGPIVRKWALAAMLAAATSASADVKIAYIDPLSGVMAATGEHGLRQLQFHAERINASGGILGQKVEIVPLDNKLSPQESLVLLNRAIDDGVRYVIQGSSSAVAAALIDAINKHNERNPDRSVLFLNYAAIDPDFTNDKCSFWHFRFEANSDMKLQAAVSYMAKQKNIKKVFIIGQDYSFGHQVSKTARALIQEKLPKVEIVGDEFHALAKVKDFSPYIAKIQASGADTVITANWGGDLALLIRAAKDAGLKANFYTFYAAVVGSPVALGEAGVDRIKNVTFWDPNSGAPYVEEYKKKYGKSADPYTVSFVTGLGMLQKAATTAQSLDPAKVAKALEGMKFPGPFGEVEMRATDHQLIQPLFINTFAKWDGKKVKHLAEGSEEFGMRNEEKLSAAITALPTTCKMHRF